jgi:hypothetical protein
MAALQHECTGDLHIEHPQPEYALGDYGREREHFHDIETIAKRRCSGLDSIVGKRGQFLAPPRNRNQGGLMLTIHEAEKTLQPGE